VQFDALSNRVIGFALDRVEPVHEARLLTYMKLAQVRIGLLINFNVPRLSDGIKRYVL
jgi:GxxExxY protein